MRPSTRSSYGIRAMVDLACCEPQGPVSVGAIAARDGIPAAYLEHILNRLRKHGLVTSVRGPRGGYRLARRPVEIRVSEIIAALDGPPGEWLPRHRAPGRDGVVESAATRLVWQQVEERVQEVLEGVTLWDLCLTTQVLHGVEPRGQPVTAGV